VTVREVARHKPETNTSGGRLSPRP
jgi:hypothetical protein